MNRWKKIKFDKDKSYTLIYATPLIVKKTYCSLFDKYPKKIKEEWSSALNKLNDEFKDNLIVPFINDRIVPGCLINEDNKKLAEKIIEKIKNVMPYNKFIISYGIGKVSFMYNDVHHCNGPVFTKVGRNMDKKKKDGIYYIK